MPKKRKTTNKFPGYNLEPVIFDFNPADFKTMSFAEIMSNKVGLLIDPEIIKTTVNGKEIIQIRGHKLVPNEQPVQGKDDGDN